MTLVFDPRSTLYVCSGPLMTILPGNASVSPRECILTALLHYTCRVSSTRGSHEEAWFLREMRWYQNDRSANINVRPTHFSPVSEPSSGRKLVLSVVLITCPGTDHSSVIPEDQPEILSALMTGTTHRYLTIHRRLTSMKALDIHKNTLDTTI